MLQCCLYSTNTSVRNHPGKRMSYQHQKMESCECRYAPTCSLAECSLECSPERVQSLLWYALSCIDLVVVIWSKYCNTGVGPSENLLVYHGYKSSLRRQKVEIKLRLRSGSVCAVGWEPNPAHTPALTKLEEAYNRCGWKVDAEIYSSNQFVPIKRNKLYDTRVVHVESFVKLHKNEFNCMQLYVATLAL